MVLTDDELIHFEAVGPTPLPISDIQGYVDHEGAKIWYAAYNTGKKKKKSEVIFTLLFFSSLSVLLSSGLCNREIFFFSFLNPSSYSPFYLPLTSPPFPLPSLYFLLPSNLFPSRKRVEKRVGRLRGKRKGQWYSCMVALGTVKIGAIKHCK
jgi:hypothetical protein